ncbi:sulfurtransferase [Undibacterium sp. RTI2.1]|uniref:sulfurtransferase n=1 Tax=unclassified Undibacterium TaxID=2630295 RepID=UPI002AB532D5|nr:MULTISPECIES: sulfurtransferase [unclassified Undibacterium]MDY7539106.1 sulfurtransferase [Undibacterium sp. 5I1]MEB0030968.1 sulfurtransferase [Undibacterium sp. RTI2.1]MEB0115815.1 sulfurtransferase [Undibacterium sp. RTI2.2]MEB0229759.1 sulfurtransferase [Undibacterium sp. 10I3]MEB0259272.1 sulfurtransferase [Undibacterium sp. 5I1]
MHTTLISATELSAQIDNPHWVILDCRHDLLDVSAGKKAYDAAHIPRAKFASLDNQLSGPKLSSNGVFHGRHPLPEKEDFIRILRAWGVVNSTQVIAYDAHGGMFAARLWWMLRWVGHKAVAVLDGGLPAWQAQGLPTTDKAPEPARGSISLGASLVSSVNVGDVLVNLATASRTLVDARAADRFRGENETMDPIGGHIPGAKNRFFKDNLQADGCFKSPQELQAEWSAIVPDASKAIMQCGSGVTACHNLLALEIAGLPGAALYPGSWSEWCAEPARPYVIGDGE